MRRLARKTSIALGTGLASLGLIFSVQAQGSGTLEENLKQGSGKTFEEVVRKFDKLCLDNNGSVYARFKPNEFDYNTKITPSSPITKAEHVRDLLILSLSEINGFIDSVDSSGTDNRLLLLQKDEMNQARDSLINYENNKNMSQVPAVTSCDEPFTKPK